MIQHLLLLVEPADTLLSDTAHLQHLFPAAAHFLHRRGNCAAVHGRDTVTGGAKIVPTHSIDQLLAAANIGDHAGTAGCKGLQNRQRLSLGNAGKNGEVKIAHILHHVYTSGKQDSLRSQLLHEIETFSVIVLIINAAEDMQPCIWDPAVQLMEGIDHRLDILDGCHSDGCTDIDDPVFRFCRHLGKGLKVNTIDDDLAFLPLGTNAALNVDCIVVQAGNLICVVIDRP